MGGAGRRHLHAVLEHHLSGRRRDDGEEQQANAC
jgi:hypothetical protein